MNTAQHPTRSKILVAALSVVRTKGYEATTVDDLCKAAGVTKGAFFHYFDSKQDLAVAAARYWSEMTGGLFASAPYQQIADPFDRLIAYIDFRVALLEGRTLPESTCLLGTMVQETFETHPAIREACDTSISSHAAEIAKIIADAKAIYAPDAGWTAESLGLYTQAVIQGGFILAKARNGPEIAADSIRHLRRYIELLFNRSTKQETTA